MKIGYSQTYIAVAVNVLTIVLPRLGIELGSEELTTTIQTVVAIVTGIWILLRRYRQGDITIAGIRK